MNIRQKIVLLAILVILPSLLGIVYALSAGGEKSQNKLSIGQRFHHETGLTWQRVIGDVLSLKPQKPPQYKTYPEAKSLQLPEPKYRGIIVEDAIMKRRSVRNYSDRALSMNHVSQLLFAAQGITGRMYGQPLRAAPSAGALYPYEIYLIVNRVHGLSPGIYHYAVLDHAIELIKEGNFSDDITDAGLKQDMLGEADVTFVFAAVFDRVRHKYGERGYRYIYTEAGHISQNIYLQSVSLGLGSVSVGAFLDEEMNQLIGVDGRNEAVIYLHAIGTL